MAAGLSAGAVIVGAVRTAVGRRNGALSQAHAVDLTGQGPRELAQRTGIDPAVVDDVIWGCVGQVGDQSGNIGRYGVLAAGWPESIPGTTINRACGSSQQALEFAFSGVLSGAYEVVVAGGIEVMSKVPLGASRLNGTPFSPAVLARYDNFSFTRATALDRVNPLGGSGAILMTRMINHMRDRELRYGPQTMCEGGGTANATLLELV